MKQFKRDKIRMYAFLTACLLIMILLSAFGVFAADNMNFIDRFSITTDDILNQNDFELSNEYVSGLQCYCRKNSIEYTSFVDIIENDSLDFSSLSLTDYQSEWTGFNNFVSASTGTSYRSALIPDGSFLTYENYSFYLIMPVDSVPIRNERFIDIPFFSKDSGSLSIATGGFMVGQNTRTIDNASYYYYSLGAQSYGWNCVLSNMPIYYTDGSTVTSLVNASDINYSKLNGGNSSDGETDLNNLYLPTSDFKWNVSKYGDVYSDNTTATEHASENMIYSNRWGSGGVQFTCVPTDYQIEHSEDFYISFEFQFWTKGWVQFEEYNSIRPSNQTFSSMKMFTNPYTVDIELSDIISDGNQYYFVMQDLFDNSTLQQYNLPYLNFSGSFYGSAIRNMREYYSIVWDNSTDLGWKGQARAVLHSRNINTEYSGNNTETYNFLTQISKQTDDSMSTNNYPYSPSEDDVVPDSSSGSNSQTMTSEDGKIILTNNDNDIININDGNAEVVEDIYNDLTVSDGEDSLPERFVDLVNQNAWITIMQETFSFVPSSIWVTVEIFVVTCLGILASALVLRIILDLL